MPTELERRARVILHDVYANRGDCEVGNAALNGTLSVHDDETVVAAIAATLQAQQPDTLCEDCPPVGYPTDTTRCDPCPRRAAKDPAGDSPEKYPVGQQPGAQAVTDELIDEAVNCAWHVAGTTLHSREDIKAAVKAIYPMFVGTFIRTPAQPPSIPEPSGEDVRTSCVEWGVAISSGNVVLFSDLIRSLLTTYTARLRERIGGGS